MKQRIFSNVALWGVVVVFGLAGCDDSSDGESNIAPTNAMHQTSDPADAENPVNPEPEQSARTVALKVDGMHCDGCAAALTTGLVQVPGVVEADVSFARGEAKVGVSEDGPTAEDLTAWIVKTNPGYTVETVMQSTDSDAPNAPNAPNATDEQADAS